MRIIGSLLGIVLLGLALFIGWQVLGLGKSQSLSITQPQNGATINGSSVPVAISADSNTMLALSDSSVNSSKDTVVVVYLDGREVQRGKALNFSLLNVPAGDHQLQARLYTAQGDSFTLSNESNVISFHSTGSTATNTNNGYSASTNPSGIPNNLYGSGANYDTGADTPQPTVAVPQITTPQPQPQSIPNTGEGGMADFPQNVANVPAASPVSDSVYGGPLSQAAPQPTLATYGQSNMAISNSVNIDTAVSQAQPDSDGSMPVELNSTLFLFALLYLVLAVFGIVALGLLGRQTFTARRKAFVDRWTALRAARRGEDTVEEQVAPTRVNVLRRLSRNF